MAFNLRININKLMRVYKKNVDKNAKLINAEKQQLKYLFIKCTRNMLVGETFRYLAYITNMGN